MQLCSTCPCGWIELVCVWRNFSYTSFSNHDLYLQGKDALLDALGALSVSCHEAITNEDSTTPTTILSLICSACRKKVKKYRESAFSCLEKVSKDYRVAAYCAKLRDGS